MRRFLDELTWRGLLEAETPGLRERLARGPITGYVGFDPTAPSLQIGNLVPLMLLAHLQRAGGTPIVVLGGGTGLIGDPSGRRTERPLLDPDAVAANVARQRKQFERFLDFDGPTAARMVDNAEWLRALDLVGFLRDVGKHFTVSYMLQKESVKARLDEGISYTEFSYMLLQAYDFLEVYRRFGCELQMGGSDQWGNITAGRELVRRTADAEVHGVCAPLFTSSAGGKFGKSEGGAVWLDPAMTPVYTFYNFWVQADDRDIEALLRIFTFLSKEEIDGLMAEHRRDPGARVPHRALARDVTGRVHGDEAAGVAEREARAIFERRREGTLTAESIKDLLTSVPTTSFEWNLANPPMVEDLFLAARLAKSKSDVRRLAQQNGLYVNENVDGTPKPGEPLPRETVIEVDDARYVLLRKGKRTYAVVRVTFR